MTRLTDATLEHLRTVGGAGSERYAILAPIGEGGMGTVYRAHDAELDREVALKVHRTAHSVDLVGRFRQEARVIARLEHPGIVPVHDAGTLPDGRAFYAMTLVRGERLDEHLARIPGLRDRLRLFARIAEPVAFAHDRGVIHRDLKPANIMVGPFGEVLVMDWGMAKVLGTAPERGVVVGTSGYMAPEQAAGDSLAVDVRADVHALGVILGDVTAGTGLVPNPLAAVIARATARRAEDRYPTASALATEIQRFLDGQPVEAYAESPGERLLRLINRYRVPLTLVLAYLAMRFILLILGGR